MTASSRRGQAVQGTGLAFIVYTEAIKNMEVSQLWSALYFLMLLMLGIGSMLGNTAAILTPLTDSKVISSHLPKEAISGEWARREEAGLGQAVRGRRWMGCLGAMCCRGGRRGRSTLTVVLPSPSPHLGQAGPGRRDTKGMGSSHPDLGKRPRSPTWHPEPSRLGWKLLLSLFN